MAAAEELKLIGTWPSPFVLRERIALNLKGVPSEFLQEANGFLVKSQLLLHSNPVYKKVPVLIHNDKPVCESLIILHYIDETWSSNEAPPLLPVDPYDRAIARFWAAYIDDKLFPAAIGSLKAPTEEARAEAIQQAISAVLLLDEAFVKCSKGRHFFAGDGIGYLDIALGSFLRWLEVVERITGVQILDEGKTPQLAAWAERFCSVEAVKKVLPEIGELLDYAKWLAEFKWRVALPTKSM